MNSIDPISDDYDENLFSSPIFLFICYTFGAHTQKKNIRAKLNVYGKCEAFIM